MNNQPPNPVAMLHEALCMLAAITERLDEFSDRLDEIEDRVADVLSYCTTGEAGEYVDTDGYGAGV